jgi:hypothetical protein
MEMEMEEKEKKRGNGDASARLGWMFWSTRVLKPTPIRAVPDRTQPAVRG